jgi:hypothetical protein
MRTTKILHIAGQQMSAVDTRALKVLLTTFKSALLRRNHIYPRVIKKMR